MLREQVVPIPQGLEPERAIFARLAGVSMSTLNTTTARAPSRVLVTGLGPVGNLAAQIFSACGYSVTAVDPVEIRRETARRSGLDDVRASIAEGAPDITGEVALHVECSGHEQAALVLPPWHGSPLERSRPTAWPHAIRPSRRRKFTAACWHRPSPHRRQSLTGARNRKGDDLGRGDECRFCGGHHRRISRWKSCAHECRGMRFEGFGY